MNRRLPVYAISHGGGPWPWIKDRMGVDWEPLEQSLAAIPRELAEPPRAILMISAHWETEVFTAQTNAAPPMLYDYGGFPEFTYTIQYPAPGAPEVAERALELLAAAGHATERDSTRGFDHGMFAPMKIIAPDADVPIAQLSIRRDFDVATHLAAGRALAPLRDEGVLIIGSGFPSFHDLRSFGPASAEPSRSFDTWLTDTMINHSGAERSQRLLDWEQAPGARECHPRPDHLIPLMVAVGAAEGDAATVQYHEDDAFGGFTSSSGYALGDRVGVTT